MNATIEVMSNPTERRVVHILNPASGKPGRFDIAKSNVEELGVEFLVSEKIGGITELVENLLREDPYANIVVYGGDGTVNEAVNGIMRSGAAETAAFSVIPMGSGNDFSAYANDTDELSNTEPVKIDLIKTTINGEVRYFANLANVGFDCDVVWETYALKKNPLFRGKMAYIAGVVKVLFKKKTIDAKLTLTDCVDIDSGAPVADVTLEQEVLLAAFANSKFYGGGFKAAPLASVQDGLMDVIAINDVTRLKFISLVGNYKAGNYIDGHGKLMDKFKGIVTYNRCKKAVLTGVERICLDGEIIPTGEDKTVQFEVVPGAIRFASVKKFTE